MDENKIDNHIILFARLGDAIDTALAIWETYLSVVAKQPTYASITASGGIDEKTKVKALQHVLETLPDRYNALIRSLGDPDMEIYQLPELCQNLLEELSGVDSDVELGKRYDKLLVGGKLGNGVAKLEKEIGEEEQLRLQELKRVKALQLSLIKVKKDGELEEPAVTALVEAMEAVGVPLVGFENEVAAG